MPNLTFTDEGPQYYGLAYARNRPMAKPGPYFTKLTPHEETAFRLWLRSSGNPTNFNPDAKIQDYDMRGYWKDVASKGKDLSAINTSDNRIHLPDTYKTPYDTTFSGESRYAKPNLPLKWVDSGVPGKERLVNTKTGEVLFIKTAPGRVPGYPAGKLPDVTQPPTLQPRSDTGPVPRAYAQQSIMDPSRLRQGVNRAAETLQGALSYPQELLEQGTTAAIGPKYGPTAGRLLGILPMLMGDEAPVANITKEQRAAWEAENAAYRATHNPAYRVSGEPGTDLGPRMTPGTRVSFEGGPRSSGHPLPRIEGEVVEPGTPGAGEPVYPAMSQRYRDEEGKSFRSWNKQTPPTPEHVAVRPKDSDRWQWMHRDSLEMLPPKEEFPIGTHVKYEPNEFESPNRYWTEGVIAKPPPNAPPSPGPDYVWADISRGKPTRMDAVRYKGGTWGGWFHKTYFQKVK